MSESNPVSDGLLGLAVGDALGVPYEFKPRFQMKKVPATTMTGYGTHGQPPGTWSDDTSLAMCLAESLTRGYDLYDQADRMAKWYYQDYWTARNEVFDIGNTTSRAIELYQEGYAPKEAGGKEEHSNGNGSLMRILPLAFYLQHQPLAERVPKVHDASCITHAHPRSQMACAIYVEYVIALLQKIHPEEALHKVSKELLDFYAQLGFPYYSEIEAFSGIFIDDLSKKSEDAIPSGGYVIHTLNAGIWCLLQHQDYKHTVLHAVNLGEDTDTTAAVAGGLAGILYGKESIPEEWLEQLARRQDIEEVAGRLNTKIKSQGSGKQEA